jgi:hypothetical protein
MNAVAESLSRRPRGTRIPGRAAQAVRAAKTAKVVHAVRASKAEQLLATMALTRLALARMAWAMSAWATMSLATIAWVLIGVRPLVTMARMQIAARPVPLVRAVTLARVLALALVASADGWGVPARTADVRSSEEESPLADAARPPDALPRWEGARIRLTDGRVIPWEAAVIRGGRVVVSLPGAAAAEWSVPLELIAALEGPEPPALAEARDALARGQALAALTAAGTVVRQFAAWRTRPGAWWLAGRTMEMRARVHLGQWADVARDAAELEFLPPGSEPRQWGAIARVRLALAASASGDRGAEPEPERPREPEGLPRVGESAAGAMRNEAEIIQIMDTAAIPEVAVEAALAAGEHALQRRDWTAALDALLRIPVFHPERTDCHAPVLLRCARAYAGLDDRGREERALLALADGYPDAPETATARREFAERFP